MKKLSDIAEMDEVLECFRKCMKKLFQNNIIDQQRNMDYFESKRSRSRYMLQESEDQYSCSEQSGPKLTKNAVQQQFQSLFLARDRFCQFVSSLGAIKGNELREDILVHCQQNSKRQRVYQAFMSEETILKIINLRIDKMIKNKRIKKNWSEEDVQILIWVTSKYADKKRYQDIEKELDNQDWHIIASLIPGVTAESCMFKWLSLKKINLATNNWSQEESSLLATLVNEKAYQAKNKDSRDWKLISQKLYFLNHKTDKIFRNAKQCRQHWNCYLNPNLKKGPWRPQEDVQLLKCIKQNKGSKKWSQIVKYFDGRTENALKNRYTLIIEKQKKQNKNKNELQIIDEYLLKCYLDRFINEVQHSPQDNGQSYDRSMSQENSFEQRLPVCQPNTTKTGCVTPPITPVKIQKFTSWYEIISKESIDFNSIRLGTLSNGVFQNESDKNTSNSSLNIRRYHSSSLL